MASIKKLNKRGEWNTILSKDNLTILVGLLLFIIFAGVVYQVYQSIFQSDQKKIIEELKGNINSLTTTLDTIKTSIIGMNTNIEELQKTKANDESVKDLSNKVQDLTQKVDSYNKNLEDTNKRVTTMEETIKSIEPSYVQNIDARDLRTYFNIFNFRLVLNFFLALSISLFALEFLKIFGDFISFGYKSKSYNIKNYIKYRMQKIKHETKISQEVHHNSPEPIEKVK